MTIEYDDEAWCGHCEKDTRQHFIDRQHERDTSHDHQECLECGWYMYGMGGEWRPPFVWKSEIEISRNEGQSE